MDKIEAELTDPLSFGPEMISTSVKFMLHNIGKAPATNVSTTISFHADQWLAGRKAERLAGEPSTSALLAMERNTGVGQVIFPGRPHGEEYAIELRTADFKDRIVERNKWGAESSRPYSVTTLHPCILIGVTYLLPGDRTLRFTHTPFEIRSTLLTHPGWNGEECEVLPGELIPGSSFMGGIVK